MLIHERFGVVYENNCQAISCWAGIEGEVKNTSTMILDWRGRFKELIDFEAMVVEKEKSLSTPQAPVVHPVMNENEGKVKVQPTFFPIYIMEESFKASLYTNVNESTSNIIVQVVIAGMRNRIPIRPSASMEPLFSRLLPIVKLYRRFSKRLVAKA